MGLAININWDSSVDSAPAAFKTGVLTAVQYLEGLFTNPVSLTINVGYGEVAGQALVSNALGESIASYTANISYSQLRNALIGENAPGASTLPVTSPFSGHVVLSTAEAKALGFVTSNSGPDGYVGFSSTLPFSYANGVTPAANQYYFIGVVEHEITEDLGRVSWLDEQPTYFATSDLYRYSSPGVRDLTTGGAGSTAYLSLDNGVTNLGTWNNNPNNGDLSDWYPSGPAAGGNDAFNDFTDPGVVNVISQNDITWLEALGYTAAPQGPVTKASVAQEQTVGPAISVALANLFSATSSGTITAYHIWEGSASGATVGTVTDGNGNVVPTFQNDIVPSLAGLTYHSSISPGTDALWVQAYDGTWGNWTYVDMNNTGNPPPVTSLSVAQEQTVGPGNTVALTSLFSASASVPITQFHIWMGSAGGATVGTLTNGGGSALPTFQNDTVTDLSGLNYHSSLTTGTDALWVQAYDGAWGNWVHVDFNNTGIPAPVAVLSVAQEQPIGPGNTVALTSLLSVSAPATITQYHVWIGSASGTTVGAVTDGSGAALPTFQNDSVSTLSGLTYNSSLNPGTDALWVQAFDGQWGNWVHVDFNNAGLAPPVTASSGAQEQTIGPGQTVALTNLFSISDGGAPTSLYHVWLGSSAGAAVGTVTDSGGSALPTFQNDTVSSLTGLAYHGSGTPGTDALWVQAYDGRWGNWVRVDMNNTGGASGALVLAVNHDAIFDFSTANETFADTDLIYNDTVVGFDQTIGDRIQLAGNDTADYALAHAAQTNGGQDTLIALNDGSSILLKGITHIDNSFFS